MLNPKYKTKKALKNVNFIILKFISEHNPQTYYESCE